MGAGIIPVALHDNKLHFLLGKEHSNKWNDFGGSANKGESFLQTAIREFNEETNGFFGSPFLFNKYAKQNHIMDITLDNDTYKTFLIKYEYDGNLPIYFNNNYKFMMKQFPEGQLKNGMYEIKEMKWFTLEELQKSMGIIRPFYRAIIKKIIDSKVEILKSYNDI